MRKLNILHVEDNFGARVATELSLIDSGIEYDLTALTTTEAALEHISEVEKGTEEPVHLLIVDSDLSPYHAHGKAAKIIVDRVSQMDEDKRPITLGLGNEPLGFYGVEVDIDLGKARIKELGRIVLHLASERQSNFN